MKTVVHFLGSIDPQPTTATIAIDPRSGQRTFKTQRTADFAATTDPNMGETACGVWTEKSWGALQGDDPEIIAGDCAVYTTDFYFTHVASKTTCRRCLEVMKARRAS